MTGRCEICGQVCGPLGGRAKSWACAGKLAHRSKVGASQRLRDELRARFGSEQKQAVRELLKEDLLALPDGAAVLDLYGGGLSAEWMLGLRPDLSLTVAEKNRHLWQALRGDARSLGFTPHFGDFATLTRRFALIWLDLCGEPTTAHDAVVGAIPLMYRKPTWSFLGFEHDPDGDGPSALYVTLMSQNRQGYRELAARFRDVATKALLEDAAGMWTAHKLSDYRQAGGKGYAQLWRLGESFIEQKRHREYEAERRNEFATHHREAVRSFYAGGWGITHARGQCKCLAQGCITRGEWEKDRERFVGHEDYRIELAQRDALLKEIEARRQRRRAA